MPGWQGMGILVLSPSTFSVSVLPLGAPMADTQNIPTLLLTLVGLALRENGPWEIARGILLLSP